MILEEETFEKFGYYPSELTSHSRKTILIACDNCGKIREAGRHHYHSLCNSCAKKGKLNPNYGKISPHRGRQYEIRICQECGKKYKVLLSNIKQRGSKYCSEICVHKGQKGEKSPHWKGGKIERNCLFCGRKFKIPPSGIKGGRGNYCSYSCARKARRFPTHHTKPELIFEEICKKNNLPFKYTGDGAFWIHNINPDFVECNGKKIAVEIFSYWHDPIRRFGKVRYSATYEGRKKILKKYGWKLVIFWQEDLERKDAERFILLELEKYEIIHKDLYSPK